MSPRIHRISAGSYTARPYKVSTHIPYRLLLPWRQLVVRLAACDYIYNRPHWLQDLECVFFACVGQVLPVPSWRYERVRYPARAMAQELSSPSRCCYKSQPDTIWRSSCFARLSRTPSQLPNGASFVDCRYRRSRDLSLGRHGLHFFDHWLWFWRRC